MDKPQPLLIGRELNSLTAAEIEDLLCNICRFTKRNLQQEPIDYCPREEGETSMHPDFFVRYDVSVLGTPELQAESGHMSGGECNEWSSTPITISVGSVDSCGYAESPVAVVKWFLDHGWSWAPNQ